jgi:hypothetical protein
MEICNRKLPKATYSDRFYKVMLSNFVSKLVDSYDFFAALNYDVIVVACDVIITRKVVVVERIGILKTK